MTALSEPTLVNTPHKLPLNPRFNSISFAQANERCFITLFFQEGTLDLTADVEEGIISSAWSTKSKQGPRIERQSWGNMQETIRIQRNTDDNWRDDSLLDQHGSQLINGESLKQGRMRGADSPQENSDWVYLATNQARIIRIDKQQPTSPS